jgi:hypothetical protein
MGVDELLALLADTLAPLGRPVFLLRASDRPEVPYLVIGFPPAEMPDQAHPDPPEHRTLDGTAPHRNARVVVETVGRGVVDVLALDHQAWFTLTATPLPDGIIHVDGLRAGTVEGHPHTLHRMRHAYTITHR